MIAEHCLSTWALPTAQGYDGNEFVIDIASSDSLTINWTPDDQARDCEYTSSISITDDSGNTYTSLSVSHTGETITTSGTSQVTSPASTTITA